MQASQAIEAELTAYKQKEQSVRTLHEGNGAMDVTDNTARLNDAVKCESAPAPPVCV